MTVSESEHRRSSRFGFSQFLLDYTFCCHALSGQFPLPPTHASCLLSFSCIFIPTQVADVNMCLRPNQSENCISLAVVIGPEMGM